MSAISVPCATVEVSDIPSNFREETLVMLFENSKRSGGGAVERVDYITGSGRALVTFKDSAGKCLTKFCQQ